MKKIGVMMLVILCCISLVSACGSQTTPNTQAKFPYKDLTEEAYVQNAEAAMNDLIAYLDTVEGDDLDSALNAYYEAVRKETAPENLTSGEVMMAYETYLLEQSGESYESIEAMGDEERKAFQDENRAEMEKAIPNALRLHNKVVEQSKTDGESTIGTYTFKDQNILNFGEDGSIGVSLV